MINKHEIITHARKYQLSPATIEKDYVLNWILAGIANNNTLQESWFFKGGTCLKKCFFKQYRFSEDLDFTVINSQKLSARLLESTFNDITEWIYFHSGIELPGSHRQFEVFTNKYGGLSAEARISYRGPLQQRRGDLSRVKLDLTNDEFIALKPEKRIIYHPYSDNLGTDTQITSYCLEEIFAEKIRALAERLRPRDLYDVIHLHEDKRWQPNQNRLLLSLKKKCKFKKISLPTFDSLSSKPEYNELTVEWDNMLAHQISNLLPFEHYWKKLPEALNWLYESNTAKN
ncbi:MAG: nucleotidyl transferase AbiEii/AbiGii toxin family protein [Coxiellaceae bacterium]|nr:nucleotidyl transferase AbiEii/AbiGii toxin family protein [Coxiellaceae bacterium]